MLAYIKTYENDKWNIQKDGFWLVLFYHSKKVNSPYNTDINKQNCSELFK